MLTLALAISAISLTLTKSHLGQWIRRMLPVSVDSALYKLFDCPFCMSFWFAAAGALTRHPTGFQPWLISTFALVAGSALISGAIIKLLSVGQHELELLREEVDDLQSEAESLKIERDYFKDQLHKLAQG